MTYLTDIRALGARLLVAIFTSFILVLGGCGDEPAKTSEADKATSSSSESGGTSGSPNDSGDVVARVNGTAIRNSDLALAEAEIGNNLGSLPDSTRRRVLVEYLVENQLFADAALKENLASGPEFDRRLEYWRLRALREAYFDSKVKSQIGEKAAKQLYDDRVKMIPAEEEVQARHILVPEEDKADKLVEELNAGADFAELAKEHSGDAGSKENGGMLGFFGKGQMVPQFEKAAFALKAGEVSKPVKSQFGWHIIKVEDRRQKPPPSFDEVKDRIIGTLVHQRAQKVAEELRKDANVEYLDPEIKALVEADEAKKAEQQKMIEQQMKKQIEGMKLDEEGAASNDAPSKTEAPAANN